MATRTLSASLLNSYSNFSPVRPRHGERWRSGAGTLAVCYPLALGQGDTTRLPGRGDEGHRETPSLRGRQSQTGIVPTRSPTGRGQAGSAGPWAAPQPSAAARPSNAPYLSRRSPPSLSPSVEKLTKQRGSEPPSQSLEVAWGREPEASRTSTTRPR